MKNFNVGVLGIGDISDVYINNLKQYHIVNVAACAGRNLQKAQDKAAAHAIAKAYATPAELVADANADIILNETGTKRGRNRGQKLRPEAALCDGLLGLKVANGNISAE